MVLEIAPSLLQPTTATRPRRPLSEHFFEGSYGEGNGWREDPEVTERLKHEGMIQRPAPLPWRQEEVRYLSRMFGLPE